MYKAVVVPVLKQLDTNNRRHTQIAGCAARDDVAHDAIELIPTNIGGDICPGLGVCEVRYRCSLYQFGIK